MINIKDANAICRRYILQTLTATTIVAVAIGILSHVLHASNITFPIAVGVVFSLVIELGDILIWRRVATKGNSDSTATFFGAVSGFRMLLALFTLLGCYIVCGREAMLEYCLVFFAFYLMLISHHSFFFTKRLNKHTNHDNENK